MPLIQRIGGLLHILSVWESDPLGPHAPDFTSPPNAGSNSYSWVAPFVIHPTKPENFYCGKDIFTSKITVLTGLIIQPT